MKTEYYTTVTATDDFWKNMVYERLDSGYPIMFTGEEAGFTITSKNKPAIGDMIELSKEFPDECFNVVISTDNICENIIEYYDFQGGAIFLKHLEPIYYFSLSEEVERLVDPRIIEEFKKEVSEALDGIIEFVPSYEHVIGCQGPKKDMVSNIQFEYGCQNTTLSAKVIGQTFIKIEIESDSYDVEPNSEK